MKRVREPAPNDCKRGDSIAMDKGDNPGGLQTDLDGLQSDAENAREESLYMKCQKPATSGTRYLRSSGSS